jgi:23S rRNA pseudouridine2605 synthase
MSNDQSDSGVRLNKLIADSGLASRRAADKMIEEGQVTVNGKRVYELGIKVDPEADRIMVNGKPLKRKAPNVYVIMNKPRGVLTTMEDPLNRPTIAAFLAKVPYRVFPVGRLDWDSEGLLLLTNDGDFANKVMHPKAEVTKTYLVKVDGQPSPDQIGRLTKGVSIVGGRVAAKYVEKIKKGKDQYAWFKIIITEGKNRQIRQMFEKIGFDVIKLQRVAIGRLRIGQLERGEIAFLNDVALSMVFQPDDPEGLKLKIADRKKAQLRNPKFARKSDGPSAKRSSSGRGPAKRSGSTKRPSSNRRAQGESGSRRSSR